MKILASGSNIHSSLSPNSKRVNFRQAENQSEYIKNPHDLNKRETLVHFKGKTSILDAVRTNNLDEVKRVLKAGANIHERYTRKPNSSILLEYEQNALHIFMRNSNPNVEILKLLIDRGLNVNDKDTGGRNPLHALMKHAEPSLEVLEILLAKGIRVNDVTNDGYSPLHMLCWQKTPNTKAMRKLLEAGINVNAQDRYNDTVLHMLMAKSNNPSVEALRLLLDNGVDVHMKDAFGRTALESYKHKYPGHSNQAAQLLESHMAKVPVSRTAPQKPESQTDEVSASRSTPQKPTGKPTIIEQLQQAFKKVITFVSWLYHKITAPLSIQKYHS